MPLEEKVIVCVDSEVDQSIPDATEDIKFTELPAQKVIGPLALTVGAAGIGFTVTVIALLAGEVQPSNVCVTVYVPEVVTVIFCVVKLFDQVFPVETEELKLTEFPLQNVVVPPALIVGAAGIGLTVTVVVALEAEVQPLASVT